MSRKSPDFALVTLRTHPETGWLQLIDWRRKPGDVEVPLRPPGQESQYCQVDLRDLGPLDCEALAARIAHNPQAVAAGVTRWTEALKLSRFRNVGIIAPECVGGTEDVLDACDVQSTSVVITKAYPGRARYVSTLKGGLDDFRLTIAEQVGHARVTDHDLGNWYDFNRRKTTRVHLDVRVHDGSAARARVLHADRPTTEAGQPWQITAPWWRPFFMPTMTIAKRVGVA